MMHGTQTETTGRVRDEGRAGRRTPTAAFTLIELLVVIVIIAILAGLSLRFISGAQATALRKKSAAHLTAIEVGLENFQIDNGEYPINDGAPKDGGAILYQALSGDGNDKLGFYGDSAPSAGKIGSSGKVYMKELEPVANSQRMVGKGEGSEYIVIDPWGSPLNYVRKSTAEQRQTAQKNEATYDLWSLGGATDDQKDQEKWISNW
jgi:prepilin-type N-terminal cleavage/methylation domain-containing protein